MVHAVALVPGFLGFNHLGDRTYFADRFVAGLRSGLQARLKRAIAVVAVPTLPLSSLAARQRQLVASLEALEKTVGPVTWHLLGHSSGGVDAALLIRRQGLVEGEHGSQYGEGAAGGPKIGSVITLSAPHYGTGLALTPLARLTSAGQPSVAGIAALARLGVDVTQRDRLRERLDFLLGTAFGGNSVGFLLHLLFGGGLARDLSPSVCGALTSTPNRSSVPISCVATIAPPPSETTEDRLYRDLWGWTAFEPEAPVVPPPTAFDSVPRIGNPPSGPITLSDNDGVVNTARQVDGELLALVGGDHGDVLGRYLRRDAADGKVIDPGLMTSGAAFTDDVFFELIDRLAATFASRMTSVPGL